MNVDEVKALAQAIRAEIGKAVIGQEDTVTLLLTALLAKGHVLLEGPPGVAKTFLAQCFARTLHLAFGRIQFTPDLMPSDITGTNIFNFQTSTFTLNKGPVFCELLLADEINRTPPKTQAALLEAMQERQVTIDGKPHPLGERFMVVATQNPLEQQGTYPLPEAQLDRFLFKQVLAYPSLEEERRIVAAHGMRSGQADPAGMGVAPVADAAALSGAAEVVAAIRLADDIVDYVLKLVRATRETAELQSGASPRSAAMLALAARAHAALDGRDYVIPDDVKRLALPALRHRVILSPAAEIEGRRADDVIAGLIEQVEAPR
ncbi:MAG: MoxR family ATPase [Phenylobacterium sp.]|uniref:AAA family ATPase n=1 Tax=Phenylobacterium sp. TaxID=1871053 RepID=UPI002A2BD9D1|nr:MoxR family ATPase [Phenylobacterium sp.]MDD3836952.1 MoxR family ATPase [Phenylobacterium sp.]MDX9999321.1 MoxR family ATPase [Phenylobacterium sp.]